MPPFRSLVISLLLLLFCATVAVAADRVVLQLPWDHQFQFAGYYAANLQGYYADAGLAVEIKSAIIKGQDFLAPTKEVLGGRADFGIGSGDIILANQPDNRLRVIASIFQSSATRFYVKKSFPFTSLAALVEHGTISRRLNSFVDIELQAMLRSEGIDPAQVKTVKAIPGVSQFVDGRVDMTSGYALTFPYEIKRYQVETTEINPLDYGINFYGDSLFTSKKLIDERPELIEKFLKASLKGWVYALEHPQQLVEYIANNLPRTHPVDDPYAFNLFQARHINQHTNFPIVQPGHINPYRWGKMYQALREAGLISGKFDAAKLIWTPEQAKAQATKRFQEWSSLGLMISLGVMFLLVSFVLLLRKLVRERTESLRQAHQQALHRQALFSAVFQSITDAMVLADQDRKIMQTNKAFSDIFGYRQEEVEGKSAQLLYADRDNDSNAPEESASIFAGHYRRKDGSRFTGETLGVKVETEDGRIIGFLKVVRDISERLEKDRQIRTLSKFPDENPGPVLRSDVTDTLLYANPASAPLLQQWQIAVGDPLPEELRIQTRKARQKQCAISVEWPCGEKIFSFVLTPVPEENYLNLYGQDVTDSKRLEEQLRQSEKMQAIGQLAGGIAHDFNNQLGVIFGSAELLDRKLSEERLKKYLASIKSAGMRAAELTQKLLAFSRKGKYLAQPVNIKKIIAEVVALLEHSIDKRIHISQELNAQQSTIIGDPALLQNALLNLALNARDAMPDGGELVFATDHLYLGTEDCQKLGDQLRAGEYLLLSVKDTGCGMDELTRQRMFEPFYTTKGEGRGTGLGLASVYATVTKHGGAVQVQSAPGQGTRLKLYLPLASEQQQTSSEPPPAQPLDGEGHILVVDDERAFREVAQDLLEQLGYQVTTCPGGKEAITLYRQNSSQFDLVILDMIMPELNGHDTFLALQSIDPDVRVLLCSGFSAEENVQEMLDLGLASFLAKPYNQNELSEKVAAILARDAAARPSSVGDARPL